MPSFARHRTGPNWGSVALAAGCLALLSEVAPGQVPDPCTIPGSNLSYGLASTPASRSPLCDPRYREQLHPVSERLSKNLTADQRAIALAILQRNESEAVKHIQQTGDNLVFRAYDFSVGTPLADAAGQGLTEVMRALLEKGVGADTTFDANPSQGRDGSTALILTLEGGLDVTQRGRGEARLSVVQLLLHAGANPNATDLDGWSPLSMSLRWWSDAPSPSSLQARAAESLLAAGADINARVKLDPIVGGKPVQMSLEPRATPLSEAVLDHKRTLITFLLDHGADPKAQDSVALAAAVHVGDKDMVELLLSDGASPNARAYMSHDPVLTDARAYMSHDSIALILLGAGADANTRMTGTRESVPLLANAARAGDREFVAALMSKGADPNARVLDPGGRPRTMLEWILGESSASFTPEHRRSVPVGLLLSAGANPNMHDDPEMLLALTRDDEPDVIGILMDKGARLEPVVLPGGERIGPISNQIRSGRTALPLEMLRRAKGQLSRDEKYALLMAVQRRSVVEAQNVELVRSLLEHKTDPNFRGPRRETALHLAALTGQVAVMEMLLAAGTDPDARTGLAPEPLSATSRVNPQITELLLLGSAAAEAKAPALRFLPLMLDGRLTPLMLAAAAEHREAVQLLLRKGAKPDLKSEYGETAAELARQRLNSEIAEDLATAGRNR